MYDTDFVVKINLILILSLLANISVFAQKDYYPGFVVTNIGDTTFGSVMDRKSNPLKLLKKIRFIDDNGKKHRYTSGEILSYKIGKGTFESQWYYGRRQFFKVIEPGYVTYYELESSDEFDNIFGTKYLKRSNEDQFTMVILIGFRKRMMRYFADCQELVRRIELKEFRL